MREIKFRAYQKNTKKWHIWSSEDGDDGFWDIFGVFDKHFKVLQYTGLKDKNGVEIYEGDIIEYGKTGRHVIKFNYAALASLQLSKVEVIGNIYENKELLK